MRHGFYFSSLILILAPIARATGPDVTIRSIDDVHRWDRVGDITAYSIGTTACNNGDTVLKWQDSTEQHPVILQNMYRLKNGRFEQIGMAWVKHAFIAANQSLCQPCEDPGSNELLGVGCSDTANFGLNSIQDLLGPRSQVNAATGDFPYPFSAPSWSTTIDRRLQVHDADLTPSQNAGALYFVEARYIAADDATSGNANNNHAYRQILITETPSGSNTFVPSLGTFATVAKSAVEAWKDIDPSVVITNIDVSGDGRFILGAKATDLGTGFWRYEYALENVSSDRAAQSFGVLFNAHSPRVNVGFHDVEYHSGESYSGSNWTTTGAITWSTQAFSANPSANALRFGTLYNFRFDTTSPPISNAFLLMGLFKPGSPSSISFNTLGPNPLAVDCNHNGTPDWQEIQASPMLDCDGNGNLDSCDFDCNGNGIPDACEISADPAKDCNANGLLDVCELPVGDPAPGGPFFCTSGCLADCNHNGKPDSCEVDPSSTSGHVVANGTVVPSPSYPYSMENYDTTNDLNDLRNFAAMEGLMPPFMLGEDRKEYDWRAAKAIMAWVASHLHYNGYDSDPSLAPRAINILNTLQKQSLILGGTFLAVDGVPSANGVAEVGGASWQPLGGPTPDKGSPAVTGLDGSIEAMCVFNDELIIGGDFANSVPAGPAYNGIVRWDGAHYLPLGTDLVGVDGGTVNALVVHDGILYVGGSFTSAGGIPLTGKLAAWNGTNWSALDGMDDNTNTVNALASFGGKLIIGRQSNTGGFWRLASWCNPANPQCSEAPYYKSLDGGPGPDQAVKTFCVFAGNLMIGGGFSFISGQEFDKVAAWNGTQLINPQSGIGVGASSSVDAMCTYQGKLVIGGRFTAVGLGLPNTKYIAQWDGADWTSLGSGILTSGNYVNAMFVHDGKLIIGTSRPKGADPGGYCQQWDGSSWSAFGDGISIDGPVYSLCEYPYHWACATVGKTILGLCVAHGIPARIVAGTGPNGNKDTNLEVYDSRNSKWAFFLGPYNNWVEDANGVPQSVYDLKTHNDAGDIAITVSDGIYSFAAANGSGLVPMPKPTCEAPIIPRLSTPWWCGAPETGDWKILYHLTTDYINKFNNLEPVEEGINNFDDGAGTPFIALNDPNLSYPLNQVQATTATLVESEIVVTFMNNINDPTHGFDLDHYETSNDNGFTWQPVATTGGLFIWTPNGLSTLLFRGVSVSGARSPSVTIVSTLDCNQNGIPDDCDITASVSHDCNGNFLPDECEIALDPSLDCNTNGIIDTCGEIDCNGNNIPDDCEEPGCWSILAGDMDCSGTITPADIPAFVSQVLIGKASCLIDMNHDGVVDGHDVVQFTHALVP